MVVSARSEASQVGISILKKGGNAFDAMVATDFALAVTYPFAGNLGGGGFMVYRTKNGQKGTLDYREKAALAAQKNMYLDKKGDVIPNLSLEGGLAVGVPGTVAGLWETHQKMGKLPWGELVQPAIDLATNGFVVTEKQAESLIRSRSFFTRINKTKIYFDKEWKAGDTVKLPQLASTLKTIQAKGRDGFYKGINAQKIAQFIQNNGGIITPQDLENYKPIWRKPIHIKLSDFDIYTMGPPSSGGVVLGQILISITDFSLYSYGHNSVEYIQVLTEAERRAYADRAYYLGDPDFVEIPVNTLLSEPYLNQRMKDFKWHEATKSSDISHGKITLQESNETTHYSIVDAEGNAVAVTTTLNGAYGSKLFMPELGFFFNNEMDDFSVKQGTPNMFGLVGGEANAIQPGKRMLSSMTPTIIEKSGELYMVLGSPGGSTIITTVLQTFLNQVLFDMTMQEAVSAPRFHHQWLPDEIMMEPNGFSPEIISELQKKGYKINEGNSIILGQVDAILRLPNGDLEAGADPRGDDAAAGY